MKTLQCIVFFVSSESTGAGCCPSNITERINSCFACFACERKPCKVKTTILIIQTDALFNSIELLVQFGRQQVCCFHFQNVGHSKRWIVPHLVFYQCISSVAARFGGKVNPPP